MQGVTSLQSQVISEVELLELLNIEKPSLDRLRLEKDGLGGYDLSENQIDPSKNTEIELYAWKRL